MEIIFKILRIKIIRIGLVFVIIYFALFSNKNNPQGLGYRFSSQQLHKDFSEAEQKGGFILENIRRAQNADGSKNEEALQEVLKYDYSNAIYKDVEIGKSKEIAQCGDEALVSYSINVAQNKSQLDFIESQKVLIGSNKNRLLEEKISGMHVGGTRSVKIPKDLKSDFQLLNNLLKFNETELYFLINLKEIKKNIGQNLQCQNGK